MAVQRCECGRPWSKCIFVVQRTSRLRLIHYRCTECSREWTVREEGIDPADPVSIDEVLDVHNLLKNDRVIAELFRA
jgi:hypothetical protein